MATAEAGGSDFPRVRSYMFGLGRSGVLGFVNRAPPLAALEFSTSLADGLEMHSLVGLRRAFDNAAAEGGRGLLYRALRAQTLKMLTAKHCIEHNQATTPLPPLSALNPYAWLS